MLWSEKQEEEVFRYVTQVKVAVPQYKNTAFSIFK